MTERGSASAAAEEVVAIARNPDWGTVRVPAEIMEPPGYISVDSPEIYTLDQLDELFPEPRRLRWGRVARSAIGRAWDWLRGPRPGQFAYLAVHPRGLLPKRREIAVSLAETLAPELDRIAAMVWYGRLSHSPMAKRKRAAWRQQEAA